MIAEDHTTSFVANVNTDYTLDFNGKVINCDLTKVIPKSHMVSDSLVDENGEYLIDGIGLQAHLYTQDDLDLYFKTIDKLSETGLKLQLTELDVCLGSYQHPQIATDDNLKVQGQFYYNLVNGLLERVDAGTLKMDALTLWGVSDAASWRREYSPLLYGITNKAKYAYYGVMQVKEKAGF